MLPTDDFGDEVLYVKQFTKDTETESTITIKCKALDEVLGFVGGLFGFVGMFVGAILSTYAQTWFNINNSALREKNLVLSDHAS